MKADFCDYCGEDRNDGSSMRGTLNAVANAVGICVVAESTSMGGDACGDCVDIYREDIKRAVLTVANAWAQKRLQLNISAKPVGRLVDVGKPKP